MKTKTETFCFLKNGWFKLSYKDELEIKNDFNFKKNEWTIKIKKKQEKKA